MRKFRGIPQNYGLRPIDPAIVMRPYQKTVVEEVKEKLATPIMKVTKGKVAAPRKTSKGRKIV